LQNVGCARCSSRIDHVGIEVKVQPGEMLAKESTVKKPIQAGLS
jgi:hypothetical protein